LIRSFKTGNYLSAWRLGKFGVLFFNSFFYSIVTVGSVVILGFMAGFAFAKIKVRITPFLYGLFITGILLAVQSVMAPLFLVEHALGFYNTRLGLLLPYIGLGLPIGVYLGTEFIKGIPDAVIESARLDGAGYIRIFLSIILPMTTPAAITVGILSFAAAWNEFTLALVFTPSDEIKSLPVGIAGFSSAIGMDYGMQISAVIISLVPMVLFYLIFRKHIVRGIAAGARF
jgi:raffinose/stachyose/melibiose transport system permease protein